MGKKHVADMKLYNILGVPPDATYVEIKKAYKLKAIKLHPDKRGGTREAQEEFTIMKNAYDILSDSKKRGYYDTMGEDGVKAMEGLGTMDPNEVVEVAFKSFLASGLRGKCFVLSFAVIPSLCLLSVPVFWCLRIDHDIKWSWSTVFIPLWIFDFVIAFFAMVDILLSSFQENPQDLSPLRRIMDVIIRITRAITLVLFILLQIFIVLKLNNTISWSMHAVLSPYYIFDGLILLPQMYKGFLAFATLRSSYKDRYHTTEYKQDRYKLIKMICQSVFHCVLRMLFAFLIALKIDNTISISWWVVFVPVWVFIFIFVFEIIKSYLVRVAKKRQKEPHNQTPLTSGSTAHDGYTFNHSNEDDNETEPSLCATFCLIVGLLTIFSPFFILAQRLQSSDYSSFYILLPWFIIVGLFNFIVCCAVVCGASTENENAQNEQGPTEDGGAEGSPRADSSGTNGNGKRGKKKGGYHSTADRNV